MAGMSGQFVYYDDTNERPEEETDTCPECDGDALVSDDVHGEVVCQDCGCVLRNQLIDTGAEWLAFSHRENEERSRVGLPMSEMLPDRGLTTTIDWKDTDAQGQPLSARKKETMKRLRTWQKRVQVERNGERNLQLAFIEINRMGSALDVPDQVSEMASVLYRDALADNLVQGRSIEGVASGCLYIACRKQQVPRSLDEFESVARIDRNTIARTYRYIAAEQNLEMEPMDPRQFVPRFCSQLETSKEVQREAQIILADAKAEGLYSGKSPTSLAGAAIYIAAILCNGSRTQSEIADVAQVTEVTIRKRYKEQLSVVDELEG